MSNTINTEANLAALADVAPDYFPSAEIEQAAKAASRKAPAKARKAPVKAATKAPVKAATKAPVKAATKATKAPVKVSKALGWPVAPRGYVYNVDVQAGDVLVSVHAATQGPDARDKVVSVKLGKGDTLRWEVERTGYASWKGGNWAGLVPAAGLSKLA